MSRFIELALKTSSESQHSKHFLIFLFECCSNFFVHNSLCFHLCFLSHNLSIYNRHKSTRRHAHSKQYITLTYPSSIYFLACFIFLRIFYNLTFSGCQPGCHGTFGCFEVFFRVQADLVICGIFICELGYVRLKIGWF